MTEEARQAETANCLFIEVADEFPGMGTIAIENPLLPSFESVYVVPSTLYPYPSPAPDAYEEPDDGHLGATPANETLLQLLEQNRILRREMPTKADLAAHDASVHQSLQEQTEELKETIRSLRHYLWRFSPRRMVGLFSAIALGVAAALAASTLFTGEVTIRSPIPELFLVVSFCFYLMSRFLPAFNQDG